MSWYLFQSSPAVKYRGIKVAEYQHLQKPKINLSWGMNEKSNYPPPKQDADIFPSTITATKNHPQLQPNQNINNIKLLTESSDGDQEELTKLVKGQNDRRPDKDAIEMFYKRREMAEDSALKAKSLTNKSDHQENGTKTLEIDKRIRYLENSLLPSCRRDSMATIFDHNLNKEVPLNESRLSGKSMANYKRNESNVVLGSGYNVFTAAEQPQKEHLQKLREMYQYEEKYKKRIEEGHFRLG